MLPTDYHLLNIDDIVKIHRYPTVVTGFEVWNTKFSDSLDKNGKFNRYAASGPFRELEEMLENLGVWDNKIAIEYENGLFVGFYDGSWRIGTKCWHIGDHDQVYTHKDLLIRYKRYTEICKSKKWVRANKGH